MYCEKGVLKYFSKFTGNILCQRVFLKKVAGVGSFLKKRLRYMCFLVNFEQFSRTPFYRTPPPVAASGYNPDLISEEIFN